MQHETWRSWLPLAVPFLIFSLLFGERILKHILRQREERELLRRAKTKSNDSGPIIRQRRILKQCSNCENFGIILPCRDAAGRTYCSSDCMYWVALGPVDFCENCMQQTTNTSTGDIIRHNGFGLRFGDSKSRCTICRSVEQRLWYAFFDIRLIPRHKYRVIYRDPKQFYSRRFRS